MKNEKIEEGSSPEKPRQQTIWYVYLFNDPRANEIVAGYIGHHACEDLLRRHTLCADGRYRSLWVVSYAEGKNILQGRQYFSYKAQLYEQTGGGKPREWNDPNIKRRRDALLATIKKGHC